MAPGSEDEGATSEPKDMRQRSRSLGLGYFGHGNRQDSGLTIDEYPEAIQSQSPCFWTSTGFLYTFIQHADLLIRSD